MILDIHTHAFHPKIAHKVVKQLEGHYHVTPVGTGLAEDLLARLKHAGIARAAVHAAATTPAQVIPANNWAIEMARTHPEFIPFGTIHTRYPDFDTELDRLEAAGIRGIKIHADFQGFRLDDPALFPILEAMRGRFIVLFHVGDRLPPDQNPSCPAKVEAIHLAFPGLTIIAAHLGGYHHWVQSLEHLVGQDVYLDTSSCREFIPVELVKTILDRHPADRVLFGSDYPLYDPGEELDGLSRSWGLPDPVIERLLTNGQALFPESAQPGA